MSTVMKVGAWLFAALFLLASIVQYNDPDPLLWMVIYLAAAVMSGLFASGRFPRTIGIVAIVVATAYAAYLASGVQEWNIDDEIWREMLGSVIIAIWMGVLVIASGRSKDEADE